MTDRHGAAGPVRAPRHPELAMDGVPAITVAAWLQQRSSVR
jgi:hypothetical protein